MKTEVAYLVGMIGMIDLEGNNKDYSIKIKIKDKYWAWRLKNNLEKKGYNIKTSLEKGNYLLRISSKDLYEELCMIKANPEVITGWHENMKKLFLKSFVSSEGVLNEEGLKLNSNNKTLLNIAVRASQDIGLGLELNMLKALGTDSQEQLKSMIMAM